MGLYALSYQTQNTKDILDFVDRPFCGRFWYVAGQGFRTRVWRTVLAFQRREGVQKILTGVQSGFVQNRTIIFGYHGGNFGGLLRYVIAYGIDYVLNLAVLWALVVRAGLPHVVVHVYSNSKLQVSLFALRKFRVFCTRPFHEAPVCPRSVP